MSFAKAALLSAVLISFGASAAYAQMGSMQSSPQREDPAVPYQAGVAAFNARNYPEAIRQLRVARRASPTDGAINYALGLAYAANGDKSEAKSSFERVKTVCACLGVKGVRSHTSKRAWSRSNSCLRTPSYTITACTRTSWRPTS